MTIQAGDILDYQGESYEIANNPLQSYFNLQNPAPVFQFTNTANWRGYIATWQITPEGKLFLTGISGTFADGRPVSLDSLFPGQTRVFASWVNEVLRLPCGPLLKVVNDFTIVYEKEWLVTITRGCVESVILGHGQDFLDSPLSPFH